MVRRATASMTKQVKAELETEDLMVNFVGLRVEVEFEIATRIVVMGGSCFFVLSSSMLHQTGLQSIHGAK